MIFAPPEKNLLVKREGFLRSRNGASGAKMEQKAVMEQKKGLHSHATP
jgi:hypothetical protein